MPTQRAFEILFSKALLLLQTQEKKDEEAISSDRLHKTTQDDLDLIAPGPAPGPVIQVLNDSLADWIEASVSNEHNAVRLIVLPPGDDDTIRNWAERNELECLEAPSHQALFSGRVELPNISQGGILVIPRLESWMLRTYRSLNLVRELLAAIDDTERKVVVGCNIYAWEFLKKSVNAAAFLPEPMTFQALNSRQLRDWLFKLYNDSEIANVDLRQQTSAEIIFDDENKESNEFFKVLAATSLGIPWVAWHLWRRSIMTQNEKEKEESEQPDEARDSTADQPDKDSDVTEPVYEDKSDDAFWVASVPKLTVPGTRRDISLLVLQAILIHDKISVEHLPEVLPNIKPLTVIPLLRRTGIISRKDDMLSIIPEAYPAIRERLVSSGVPVGVL